VGVRGNPRGREQTLAHGRAVYRLNRTLARNPALTRLAVEALPGFAKRTGINADADAEKLDRFFAIETANLVLARILLIRFLEDHGFFDVNTPDGQSRRRYLCNGGVAAFQGMREYFRQGYTRLLEEAYRSGAEFYAAAFNETEHDWVLALADDNLSRTVEWAMFRLARFDFTTIRGDILTGIYDRFLDARQRKQQGEYYTPPSIARYIIDRLAIGPGDAVIDPASGSGTFLIERYQQMVGEDADRGLATYADAAAAMELISGNDLNPFSAVLTQIQLLWHLLAFGPIVRRQGLPPLHITERANSLVPTNLSDQSATLFGDVDHTGYAAVVGNPPYVRPERAVDIDPVVRDYYAAQITRHGVTHAGITVDANIYRLFIYRALDHWCRQPGSASTADGLVAPAGKLGFVIPLSFCSSNDAADLRRLFAPGGRWTIREVVDMELIWRDVFDADVLPMILIAEARPPSDEDQVVIRLVDDRSVLRDENHRRARPTFDLDRSPTSSIAYSDLFTPEGRIATRLTPERLDVVKHLRGVAQLRSAAKVYWLRRRGGRAVTDVRPVGVEADWTKTALLCEGAARRGTGTEGVAGGLDLYKGENVRTGGFAGEPAFRMIELSSLSTPSVWRYPQILPRRMWALPIIEQVPCAAPFDPTRAAVLNTVTVFGPRDDLVDFPFDLALTSRIYGWYTLLSLRSSYQNKLRSHLYPTTIGRLPWTEELAAAAPLLEGLRVPFFTACRRRYEAEDELRRHADALGLRPLREVVRANAAGGALVYSDHFDEDEQFTIALPAELIETGDMHLGASPLDEGLLVVSEEGHTLTFPTPELARLCAYAFRLADGKEIKRGGLLRLPTPPDAETAARLRGLFAEFEPAALETAVFAAVDRIDEIVGAALGLTPDQVEFVRRDMQSDPFLSRVRPRYPYFTPALRGRRISLESGRRYGGS
jgi:hypothetical protein